MILLAVFAGCATACRKEHPQSARQDGVDPGELDRLRSLPYAGFAENSSDDTRTGVIVFDEQRACPGYNLASLHRSCAAELTELDGTVVRSWTDDSSRHWANCELLPNGDLLVVGTDPFPGDLIPDDSRYLMRLTWEGDLVWKRKMLVHHDVELTPDGQLLTLTFDTKRLPNIHPTIDTRDDLLTLLNHDGETLAECSLYDAMGSSPEIFRFQRVAPEKTAEGRALVDLFHANSIEWMHQPHLFGKDPIYGPNNILLCTRHQDTLAVIDWASRKLLWAWGQGQLSGPHDATVLDDGHILLFDNGLARGWSRVIEIDPLTRKIVWEYKAPNPRDFYSKARGASQRLPNGNTLIVSSDNGHAFEVMRDGQIVWEYLNPHREEEKGRRGVIGRMKRYDVEFIHRIQQQREHTTRAGGG